ncbi:MAG: RNA polymerase subunit sigma, partial [Betaproteobacteria bacterium]|nr:RNA polymerase subunit sigma [Betaproteobacteria bacterium]
MFIRTTQTRNSASGETYTTHRLVESRRVGGKVRQVTL